MNLDPGGLVIWPVVGALAGWLAGRSAPAGGRGLVGHVVIGVVGAFSGGLVLSVLGIGGSASLLGSTAVAAVGAVVLLAALRPRAPRPA
jgi:uncharacterized membrane protein YeaQ/YmgE (transglycosylase-associated protein family)